MKTLFGVESVKDTQAIDMVIKLEDWDKDKEYDRLGIEDSYTEFLGNQVVCHSIPVRPGVIWPLSLNQLPSITDRRRWGTTGTGIIQPRPGKLIKKTG